MARKSSTARAADAVSRSRTQAVPMALLAPSIDSTDAIERTLTSFAVEDDLASIIPMPDSIPAVIRATITTAIAQRFTFADELDDWLHAPHDALDGDSPFERIVDGDGIAVLMALAQGRGHGGIGALVADLQRSPPPLRLVR